MTENDRRHMNDSWQPANDKVDKSSSPTGGPPENMDPIDIGGGPVVPPPKEVQNEKSAGPPEANDSTVNVRPA